MRELRKGSVFLTTLRLQLLPVMPFGIFNYAAGVGHFPFLPFLTATAIGILPGTVAAVYVGDRVMAGITRSDKSAFVIATVVVAGFTGKVVASLVGHSYIEKRLTNSKPDSYGFE